MRVLIKGAGVAGLTLAHELARRGVDGRGRRDGAARRRQAPRGLPAACWRHGASGKGAEQPVLALGREAADWWDAALPGHVIRNGTLVVAPPRDAGELARFAARTSGATGSIDADEIAALEPDLAGRFRNGAVLSRRRRISIRAGRWRRCTTSCRRSACGSISAPAPALSGDGFDRVVDCTGARAIGQAGRICAACAAKC